MPENRRALTGAARQALGSRLKVWHGIKGDGTGMPTLFEIPIAGGRPAGKKIGALWHGQKVWPVPSCGPVSKLWPGLPTGPRQVVARSPDRATKADRRSPVLRGDLR